MALFWVGVNNYPRVVSKLIAPERLLTTYAFVRHTHRPTLDAALELKRRVKRGELVIDGLPARVIETLNAVDDPSIQRLIPPKRGAFGQRS